MSIKVLIVGCGAVIHEIYKKSLIKLQKQGQIKIVGLIDPNRQHTEALQSVFRTEAVFDHIDSAVDAVDADLAIVSSPPFLHAEHSISALNHGLHVLCEKPMASSPEECLRMIEVAKAADRRLAIGMTRRFYPSFHYVKHWIEARRDLEDLTFSYREGGQYRWPIKSGDAFQRNQGGSGLLMDVGSHALDTMRWLFGPLSIDAYCDDALVGGVESNVILQIRSPYARGRVQLSWNHPLANQFRISDGHTEMLINPLDMHHVQVRTQDASQYLTPDIDFPRTCHKLNAKRGVPENYQECVYYQIVQVLRAIRFGEPVPVTGEEGLEVIANMENCYRLSQPIAMDWLAPMRSEANTNLHWSIHQ